MLPSLVTSPAQEAPVGHWQQCHFKGSSNVTTSKYDLEPPQSLTTNHASVDGDQMPFFFEMLLYCLTRTYRGRMNKSEAFFFEIGNKTSRISCVAVVLNSCTSFSKSRKSDSKEKLDKKKIKKNQKKSVFI